MAKPQRQGTSWRDRVVYALGIGGLLLILTHSYLGLSPIRFVETVDARVLVVRDTQTPSQPVIRRATVALDSGEVVSVRLPTGLYLQPGETVRVGVYDHDWPPRRRTYRLSIAIE